jgi:hypothetical protein
MKNNTASAAGGAMPAEGHKSDPRLMTLRQLVEKAFHEMDALLDGLAMPAEDRALLADCLAETLLKSPIFAGMSVEGLADV